MNEELLSKILNVVGLAQKSERASINASLCGTDWDYKKARKAEDEYGLALTELEEYIAKLKIS